MKKTANHPSGEIIIFDEESHTYTVNKKKYISVTTLIHSCFPEFDTYKIAKKYAYKNKLDVNDVINQWECIKNEACDFGSNVHKYAEEKLLGNQLPDYKNDKEKLYFGYIDNIIECLLFKCNFIYSEYIIFSQQYNIAGTVDLIMEEKDTGDILIMDWKTNKEIKFDNKWEKGLGKLSNLDNCNFNHYSLQLNLYKNILLQEKYFQNRNYKMIIIHIDEKGPHLYRIKDMDSEIEYICKEVNFKKYSLDHI